MIHGWKTVSIGLGMVAVSSLGALAHAYPSPAEGADSPGAVQIETVLDGERVSVDDFTETQEAEEAVALVEQIPGEVGEVAIAGAASAPVGLDVSSDAPVAIAPVTQAVLDSLSPEQLAAIAAIIRTAEETAQAPAVADLPREVLAQLDQLPVVEQRMGRRRWLPTGLVRRLPQRVMSLIRQPRNTALVTLGNHILVVNPVTGAVLGAVLSAL